MLSLWDRVYYRLQTPRRYLFWKEIGSGSLRLVSTPTSCLFIYFFLSILGSAAYTRSRDFGGQITFSASLPLLFLLPRVEASSKQDN